MDLLSSIVLLMKGEKSDETLGGFFMKKMISTLLAGALVLGLFVTGALAVGPWHQGGGRGCHGGLYYQDVNGDGVCDYHGTNCAYVDTDGNGVCDYHGTGCAHADTDGDGICDYHGAGCAYVDTNGNGVCDNWGAGCAHADADGDGLCDLCGRTCGLGNSQGHHGGGHHGGRWN